MAADLSTLTGACQTVEEVCVILQRASYGPANAKLDELRKANRYRAEAEVARMKALRRWSEVSELPETKPHPATENPETKPDSATENPETKPSREAPYSFDARSGLGLEGDSREGRGSQSDPGADGRDCRNRCDDRNDHDTATLGHPSIAFFDGQDGFSDGAGRRLAR
jgi:hypothetical protein